MTLCMYTLCSTCLLLCVNQFQLLITHFWAIWSTFRSIYVLDFQTWSNNNTQPVGFIWVCCGIAGLHLAGPPLHIVLLARPHCPLARGRSKAPEETDQQRPCLIRSFALHRLVCGLEVLSKRHKKKPCRIRRGSRRYQTEWEDCE